MHEYNLLVFAFVLYIKSKSHSYLLDSYEEWMLSHFYCNSIVVLGLLVLICIQRTKLLYVTTQTIWLCSLRKSHINWEESPFLSATQLPLLNADPAAATENRHLLCVDVDFPVTLLVLKMCLLVPWISRS